MNELTATHVIPAMEIQLRNSYEILDEAGSALKATYKERVNTMETIMATIINKKDELEDMVNRSGSATKA